MNTNYEDIINSQLKETKLNNITDDIILSNKEIEILNEYNIDYLSCNTLTEILYLIDQELINEENTDLEVISLSISERNYYYNTNK